jgi:hypothetical protein
LAPQSICEIGCGAGEILRQLQLSLNDSCIFWGYEVSPQAFELCRAKSNDRLHFKLGELVTEQEAFFDVLLVIDVIEHVEDYFGLLRGLRPKSQYKILHIPLELSARELFRRTALLESRSSVGHLHYFTKDLALQSLRDTGYTIVDYSYTYRPGTTGQPVRHNSIGHPFERPSLKRRTGLLLRKALFSIDEDFAARIMGGYSLMVVAT